MIKNSTWAHYKHHIAALTLLVLVTLLTFQDVGNNGFHFDDLENITSQASIRLETFSLSGLIEAADNAFLSRRPLPSATFAFDWWRGNGEPSAFQWTNLGIHIANSCLVFLLLVMIGNKFRDRKDASTVWMAFLCAALWALHPIQIQSITYIVQRMASMATLFTLISIIAYIKARDNGLSLAWLAISLIAFMLGTISKEIAWITPLLILLIEYSLVRHNQPLLQKKFDIPVLSLPVIIFILVVIDLVSARGPLSHFIEVGYSIREFTLGERLLTQPRVILFYFSQYLWPLPGQFSIEHAFSLSKGLLTPASTLWSLLIIIVWCIGGIYLLLKTKYRILAMLMLWIPATLAIESGVIPLEIIFEHRMYLPSIGIAGLLFLALLSLDKQWRRALIAVTIIFICFCINTTLQRIPDWQDSLTLYERALDNAPESARLWSNLAPLYLKAGEIEKGQNAAQKAIQLDKDNPLALEINGVLLMDSGRYREAERLYLVALAQGHPTSSLFNHLGELYLKQEQYSEAIRYFNLALEQKPWHSTYHWNIAVTFEKISDCKQAYQHWQKFLSFDKNEQDKNLVREHLQGNYQTADGRCYNKL